MLTLTRNQVAQLVTKAQQKRKKGELYQKGRGQGGVVRQSAREQVQLWPRRCPAGGRCGGEAAWVAERRSGRKKKVVFYFIWQLVPIKGRGGAAGFI